MSDFSRMLPNNQTVLDRDQKWNRLFQKYENCHDCEEDGYDIRDLIACAEVEDEELEEIWNDEEEAIESSEESMDSKENNQELVLYNSKPKNLQDLEKVYEPEFIQGLKKAFNKRCLELDGLNLTFWKRSKTHETFNESNIKTPNFESTSRSYFRSTEQICQSAKKSQKNSSPEPFKAPHPVNLNHNNFQFGNLSQNLDHTSNFETSQRFPFQINDLMNGSQKINIRIREMHYDLSVDGRDITELFLPSCNSTYKNVIPSLENITMNSTIQNQNFQKMKPIRPAIKYDVDQIRTEIPQKVMERTESNISNEEPLNNSVIDKFEGINLSNISSDGYNSKESKKSKRNAHKKKSGKKHRKSKRKETKINVKDLPHIETLMPVSEKLELSYSDVVRLSTKNDLKVSKSCKPVNDSKKQVDQQRAEKSVQVKKEKKYEEILKSYRNIIDSDTSTEDIVEQTNVTKKSKKVDQSKQQQEEKKLPKEKQKVDISTMQKDQKLKDLNKLEIQKPKVAIPSKESTNNQKNHKAKANEKLKEKPEVSNKSKEPEKIQKSSKENKSKIETSKSKIPTNDQVKIVKQEKLKVQQKSKETIESTKKQHLSSKTVFKGHEKKNEPELQYDENGVPFRNIGGFIVRYEANDSDNESSLEDDTEFFRRIHAEIRQKKALNAQKF